MDVNYVEKTFTFMALVTGIVGLMINTCGYLIPDVISSTYRYGKVASPRQVPIVSKLEVPKRWFRHFYEFAAPTSSIVLAVMISTYIFHCDVANEILRLLDLLFGSQRRALVSPESALLAATLITMQCWKRWYETNYITVFSNAKMNVCHYVAGFVHYNGFILCVVGESEGFVRDSIGEFDWRRITGLECVCAVIFVFAFYEQLATNVILANLRKNKDGNVVTNSYKVPYGGLFTYISSPLQLTEIVMYATLSIILWDSSTYHYVFVFVFVNQIETAILSHQWYRMYLEGYPKDRKTLIPFLF